MKSFSSREVIQLLLADGWYEVCVVGSHHQYKHPLEVGHEKSGLVLLSGSADV